MLNSVISDFDKQGVVFKPDIINGKDFCSFYVYNKKTGLANNTPPYLFKTDKNNWDDFLKENKPSIYELIEKHK